MLKKPKVGLRFSVSTFSLLSLLILVLSACGAQGTPTTGQPGTSNKPVAGGTWIDDIGNEPDSLIPNGGSQTFSVLVDQALYSPLFVGDYNGNIKPYIATEVPTVANGGVSADAKTWTFHIRPGVKWSDGHPLTAEDVDFTWKLWKNPKFGAASTVAYDPIESADVSADKLSITFHLKEPFAPFVSGWVDGGLAPLPKHHFESMKPEDILKSKDNLNPSVVSGPFTMSESQPGNHYTLVKNPNYWQAAQGLPYLDKIVFKVIDNQDTILKDFQAGTATSAWFVDVSKTESYKKLSNYNFVVNPNASNFEAFVFNFTNPILGKNLEVRKAIAMAVDRDAMIKTARKGQATPLCIDHGKAYKPGYQPDAPCPKFDPAAANQLLDSAGWVKGPDGVRVKNGQRLEFKYSTTSGKPWRESDELIIQSNLKDIGIKINIENHPASEFFGPFLNGGKHDIAEFESSWVYDPDDATLLSCSQIPDPKTGKQGQNWSFYCNPELEKLFKQEQQSADPNVRQDAFNKIHQIELTDFPLVVLYSPTDPAVVKKVAHNYGPGPMGASETINVWEWWCDGGQC
ncbi:MAG: peptide ABC transporter substrate-binding protein [Ktedonobacteraceae bacterium]|nr:peptide ABC transporter substrate-binding protein [Ktedonobacteraceae bacterium]